MQTPVGPSSCVLERRFLSHLFTDNVYRLCQKFWIAHKNTNMDPGIYRIPFEIIAWKILGILCIVFMRILWGQSWNADETHVTL
jgi:hypothetical protein